MRRVGLALLSGVLVIAVAGCGGRAGAGGDTAGATTGPPSPTATPSATSDRAAIFIAVLRQYLTSADASFGVAPNFPAVYVLDRADPNAADPVQPPAKATPETISAADKAAIRAALADDPRITFIADRDSVLETPDRCARVRGGGILITVAPPVGGDDEVKVGINGFVACLGATWLTYVVKRQSGAWTVTGTTGSMAIA